MNAKLEAAIAAVTDAVGLRTSVKELEAALKANGLMHTWDYVRDAHARRWILSRLETPEAIMAFLDELDAERPQEPFPGPCQKARHARSWFKGDSAEFWLASVDRMQHVLSVCRRTHCGCHEVGSFRKK